MRQAVDSAKNSFREQAKRWVKEQGGVLAVMTLIVLIAALGWSILSSSFEQIHNRIDGVQVELNTIRGGMQTEFNAVRSEMNRQLESARQELQQVRSEVSELNREVGEIQGKLADLQFDDSSKFVQR